MRRRRHGWANADTDANTNTDANANTHANTDTDTRTDRLSHHGPNQV